MDEVDRMERQRELREQRQRAAATERKPISEKKPEPTEGWKMLLNAPKAHYFVGMRSLCGRWMILSNTGLEQDNDDSPDNCKACMAKLKERREKEKAKK